MNAIIYCRVSSKDQIDGTSLESQETACREYATRHNISIVRVFVERGESAKFADRTQLLELLGFCKDKSHKIDVLLVWKIDRFARNVEDHYSIKAALRKLGVRVVSVTEPIDADANGKLLETILAGFAQFDNDVRALRTIQGLKQRLKDGIFPWKPPLGYLPPKTGKKLQPDRPDPGRFELIQKAWKLLATGAYTKADILRLVRSWGVPAYRGGLVNAQTLDHMFQNPYYAGILRDKSSGAEYHGRHVPMVTIEEFLQVQKVTAQRHKRRSHCRLHPAFPLRGLVRCPTCQTYMTSCFARGRRQTYPYYLCFRRDCPTRSRSYPAPTAHDEFAAFLNEISLSDDVAEPLIEAVLAEQSIQRANVRDARALRHRERTQIEAQLRELVSMRTRLLISDQELVEQRTVLQRRIHELEVVDTASAKGDLNADDAASLVDALKDLNTQWRQIPTVEKAVFGRLVLPAGYVYDRIRTADRGLLFSTFGGSREPLSNVVAFVSDNLNTLNAEIRKLLAIIQRSRTVHEEAA